MVKTVFYRRNGLRENGVFSINGLQFFYKSLPYNFFQRELAGYRILQKYYPVPRLLQVQRGNNIGLLIFEYEDSIQNEKGLLVDLFANRRSRIEALNPILNLYRRVFLRTLKKARGLSCDIFFKDRIPTRLTKFYSPRFVRSVGGKVVFFNGQRLELHLEKIISDIKSFFKEAKLYWCVVSQCDPIDLNLGIKPILFDYEAGGWNPLTAEFAAFFWYNNIAQGNYQGPLYSSSSFKRHRRIYNCLDQVRLYGNKLEYKSSLLRQEFVSKYINRVLIPCFEVTGDYKDWYKEFKNYLAMKILCRFNLTKMAKRDMLLSLCLLEYFYNVINPKNPEELLLLTKKIWRN